MKREWMVCVALLVCSVGCGSPDERAEEEAARAAQEAGDAARQAGDAARQAGNAARQAGDAAQQAAQQNAQQGGQMAQGAQEAARGLEGMANALSAMAGGAAGAEKPVEPVSFRELIALLPEVDGWQRDSPAGERMTAPFPFSTAEATYTRGTVQVEVTMTDSGFNQLLLAPYAMFLASGYERETTDGYERSTPVGGQPGWEKWSTSGRSGELNALVGKRYLVQIQGRNLDDPKVLREFADRLDLARLAALK